MEPHLPPDSLALAPADGPGVAARAAARAGLYVHVPFCATRCTYCDFSSGKLSSEALERYLAGIEHEAAMRAPAADGLMFHTVFFGGGTPSALPSRAFARVWRAITQSFAIAPGAEITLEANPESVRPALLEAWAAAGVNRLSMGAQSFDAEELALLGRIHDAARPAAAMAQARGFGFRRLSLDLMFGFPGHTEQRWRDTIERALEIGTEHLSAYCFIPEAGTLLGDAALQGARALPSPEAQADLYEQLVTRLAHAGHGCYETSNFCRPGAEARHNLVYWLRRPYGALGPSAHGFLGGERYANHYGLVPWVRALESATLPEESREQESEASTTQEIVMLALRLGTGYQPADHAPEMTGAMKRRYGAAFAEALATGRLERCGDGVRVPPRHRFVADDVIAWIDARVDTRAAA